MKRYLVAVALAVLLGGGPGYAQSGSSKGTTQLIAEIGQRLPDQTVGSITPFSMRQVLLDMVASSAGNVETAVNDINYPALITDVQIAYASLTVSRSVTVPAASSVAVGTRLWLFDRSGNASAAIAISVAPTGADLVNGANASLAAISTAYGGVEIESDGVSRWTVKQAGLPSLANNKIWVGNGSNVATQLSTLPSALLTGSYTGITGVGTITVGTWQATKIGLAFGGTNADLSATGGASQVLKQTGVGSAVTVAQLACSDLSGVGSGCSNSGANPTASIGLSAINGVSASYMRADGAPALSQAIVPTWTGQHAWSGAGIVMLGTPPIAGNWHWGGDVAANLNITTSGGTNVGGVTAGSNTVPEIVAQFGITSATGSANAATAYKIGLASWAIGNSGSANTYGQNTIAEAGASFSKLLTATEFDLNNKSGTDLLYASVGTSNAIYGATIASGSTNWASAALWIVGVGASKNFSNGIVITGAKTIHDTDNTSASFNDTSNSYQIIRALGTHNNGINLFGANITGGLGTAFISPNNVGFGSANAAGNATIPLIYLDASNVVNVSNGTDNIRLTGNNLIIGGAQIAGGNIGAGCGTTPTLAPASTAVLGGITAGTTPGSCVITFPNALSATPPAGQCIVYDSAGFLGNTATTAALTFSPAAGQKVTWFCPVNG